MIPALPTATTSHSSACFSASTSLTNTGPTKDPEFHLKARSTRFGANFEWPDPSPKLIVTGRVEGDFEGNFSEVDNRDVTSLRSSALQLRLAYVRLDYNITDRMDLFFEGGQDWAIFSSTVLPNLFETTFLGAFYGTIYDRSPQMRFGTTYKLSNWRNLKISPEFALMMPSTGQIEKLGSLSLAGQIGQAEREARTPTVPRWNPGWSCSSSWTRRRQFRRRNFSGLDFTRDEDRSSRAAITARLLRRVWRI